MTDIRPKPFDAYEVHGCITINDPGGSFTQQCDDSEATFWTLFGHIPGQGLETIGDFETRLLAEEMMARIHPNLEQTRAR